MIPNLFKAICHSPVNLPIIIRYIVLDHLQKLLFIPVPNYKAFEVEPTFKVMYLKYFLRYDYALAHEISSVCFTLFWLIINSTLSSKKYSSHFYDNQLLSVYNTFLPTKIWKNPLKTRILIVSTALTTKSTQK